MENVSFENPMYDTSVSCSGACLPPPINQSITQHEIVVAHMVSSLMAGNSSASRASTTCCSFIASHVFVLICSHIHRGPVLALATILGTWSYP